MGSRQLCFLSDRGLSIADCKVDKSSNGVSKELGLQDVHLFKYSPDKVRLVVVCKKEIVILNSSDLSTVKTLDIPDVADIDFSPKGLYMVTQERYRIRNEIPDESGTPHHNIKIISSVTFDIVTSYNARITSLKYLKWTEDEEIYVRVVKDAVRFFYIKDGSSKNLVVKNVIDISVSPGPDPKIAVFAVDGSKTIGHRIKTYAINSLDSGYITSTFVQTADRVSFLWSSCGCNLLTLVMTDVDHTGKSYYGSSILYLTRTEDKVSKQVHLDPPESVHSVDWNPIKDEFAVVYGRMPASSSIFSGTGDKGPISSSEDSAILSEILKYGTWKKKRR